MFGYACARTLLSIGSSGEAVSGPPVILLEFMGLFGLVPEHECTDILVGDAANLDKNVHLSGPGARVVFAKIRSIQAATAPPERGANFDTRPAYWYREF
jgi:hypothetical protein